MAEDDSPLIKPTWAYHLFSKANDMGITVNKYLTGHDGPLLFMEWYLQQKHARATHVIDAQRKG